jgi:ribonuclease Z
MPRAMTSSPDYPEVIFLGTGPAMGLNGRATSCYGVRAASRLILVDCGPCVIQQLHAAGIAPHAIDDVCFTHAHADHAAGYPMLMLWRLFKAPAGVGLPRVIASQSTLAALDGAMAHLLGGEAGLVMAGPRVALPADQPAALEIDDQVVLRTWPMAHTPFAPDIGLRFEIALSDGTRRVAALTGDTGPCANVALLARDADLLVHEATFSADLRPELADGAHGHSTARIAGRQAAAARAKRLALAHIDVAAVGQEIIYIQEAAREFPGPVCAPTDGTVLAL